MSGVIASTVLTTVLPAYITVLAVTSTIAMAVEHPDSTNASRPIPKIFIASSRVCLKTYIHYSIWTIYRQLKGKPAGAGFA